MAAKICLFLWFFCFSFNLDAASTALKTDSLLKIIKLSDQNLREKGLINYIRNYLGNGAISNLGIAKAEMDRLLVEFNVENRLAISHFGESVYQNRLSNLNAAENELFKAIESAGKSADHYLLYVFFSHLAFLQTYRGNTIEAVTSFRMANKEAIILGDAFLQALVDINISDIYYRNNFYSQSIFYLNQAQLLVDRHQLKEQRLKNIIYYNKSENYFRMNKIDSLKRYNKLLYQAQNGTYKLYAYRNRTDYYINLLNHDYKNAIQRMLALQKDSLYKFDNTDEQNLADAYHNAGQPDSAKAIINRLLSEPEQNNHPEIKFHLYKVLGEIDREEKNYERATYNFTMALKQSEEYINRLTQVGNISSLIKIDEMQGSYIQKEEQYKRERLWLIFIVVVALLTIVIVTLFYRSNKQKRYYEKLLFATQKKELAFINSHEVRRHLSNILGIIELIKHSEDKSKEYLHAEEHLLHAAKSLDAAIKNISEKLDN